MWQEVGMAALVGVALSDSWLCLFMGAAFATADRRMGWGFLVGRTMGILALLLLIGLLGSQLMPGKEWVTPVFAVSTMAVAAVLTLSVARPGILGGCAHTAAPEGTGGSQDGPSGCGHECEGCVHMEGEGVAIAPTCDHVPEGLLRRLSGRGPWATGMAVGGIRGTMPCLKVLLIVPLLVASPAVTVVLMALAFTLTSTVYPLLGLMSGRALGQLLDRGRYLRLAGAAGIAAVAVITLMRYYQRTCDV